MRQARMTVWTAGGNAGNKKKCREENPTQKIIKLQFQLKHRAKAVEDSALLYRERGGGLHDDAISETDSKDSQQLVWEK